MTITRISDDKFQSLLEKYANSGGVIDFNLFRIAGVTDEKQAHLLTAQATLQAIEGDIDGYFSSLAIQSGTKRDNYFKVVSSPDIAHTGNPVTPEVFFGTHFNFKEQKPILLGRVGKQMGRITYFGDYFHFDAEETQENIVSPETHPSAEYYKDYATQGYASAFLEPPHSFGSSKSRFDLGRYFLEFNHQLFGDFDKMIIYSWGVDCSNYFDDGKEWWGSYFWTVYNPSQDIYIGITASTTD